MRVFVRRGAVLGVLLALALLPAPVSESRAQPPDGPFAELFSQLAGRLVGVVVNISTTQAPAAQDHGQPEEHRERADRDQHI